MNHHRQASGAGHGTDTTGNDLESDLGVDVGSRYEAIGLPVPDPGTKCPGRCDGIGVVPIYLHKGNILGDHACVPEHEETDPVMIALWEAEEARKTTHDGWQFVRCPTCKGTRKRLPARDEVG